MVVISEAESGRSVTTEGSSESEENQVLSVPSILGGDESLEVGLRNVWLSFMVDVQDQLFSGQQLVDSESSSFDGDC